jgi:hypothetical protein
MVKNETPYREDKYEQALRGLFTVGTSVSPRSRQKEKVDGKLGLKRGNPSLTVLITERGIKTIRT